MIKHRELINLLNRAAAAIETPDDLTKRDFSDLVEDLVITAAELELAAKLTHPLRRTSKIGEQEHDEHTLDT